MTVKSTRSERAIHSSADDRLERMRFIERLAASLVSSGKSTGVVIGITGPWGSGKSSILNLLQEHIKAKYDDALVVRFDPWLVSSRNDLIGEFFGELIGTINGDKVLKRRFKSLAETVVQYGKQLAPIADIWVPWFGKAVSGSLSVVEGRLRKEESLNDLRRNLEIQLDKVSSPIIVLIDEIDRVEDDEIRAVAQLVRAVGDFPGISYVLAYDTDRVIQALGAGVPDSRRDERGRGYLEKIVQHQIPIPAIFDDEVSRLITTDLKALSVELRLPEGFEHIQRYNDLLLILVGDVVHTLRDIQRLLGTYHVLRSMLMGEVDWVDLLAYSALLTKSPATVEMMKREPEDYIANPFSTRGAVRHLELRDESLEDRVKRLVPASEQNECTNALLGFLFPRFSDGDTNISGHGHSDAFHQYRAFFTTLKLGLLPGTFSRDEVSELVNGATEQVHAQLLSAYEGGSLSNLVDRIGELYPQLVIPDHAAFWMGVAEFVKKPDCEWQTSYSPMYDMIREFSGILEGAVGRNLVVRSKAVSVFNRLIDVGESELTAHWIRRHIFTHGLFGQEQHERGDNWFLTKSMTERSAKEVSELWRQEHLSGRLLPCRWDLMPVFTMINVGAWDEACQQALDDALEDDRALDGFTLMLFGGHYKTDPSTIASMCTYENYIERARSRKESTEPGSLNESVDLAFQKALDNWP